MESQEFQFTAAPAPESSELVCNPVISAHTPQTRPDLHELLIPETEPVAPNPARTAALLLKHQALKTLSRLNREGIRAGEITIPEFHPFSSFVGWLYRARKGAKTAYKQVLNDVLCGEYGAKDYDLIQLEEGEAQDIDDIIEHLGNYFPADCIQVQEISPPRILFSSSAGTTDDAPISDPVESVASLSGLLDQSGKRSSSPDPPTRIQALKQLYEALKQLSDLNKSEIEAGTVSHPSEETATLYLPWIYMAREALLKVNDGVYYDVEVGRFGTKIYPLLTLKDLGPGASQKHVIAFFADHFPASCIATGNKDPMTIYFSPNN